MSTPSFAGLHATDIAINRFVLAVQPTVGKGPSVGGSEIQCACIPPAVAPTRSIAKLALQPGANPFLYRQAMTIVPESWGEAPDAKIKPPRVAFPRRSNRLSTVLVFN